MAEGFRERIHPPELREVFDFWMASCPPDRFPAFADLDLMTVPRLVKSCFVMDALGHRRYRYRFVGTEIDRHLGFPMTGRRLDEARRGKLLDTLTEWFGVIEETGQAGYVETHMQTETRDHMLYHRLGLPLSSDGKVVDKIFGAHFFQPVETLSPGRPYVEADAESREGRVMMIFQQVRRVG